MAHFAKIENGIDREVVVVNNEDLKDKNGVEQESIGAAFCHDLFGGEWVQTSYNGTIRGTFAGVNYEWDGTNFNPPVFDSTSDPQS